MTGVFMMSTIAARAAGGTEDSMMVTGPMMGGASIPVASPSVMDDAAMAVKIGAKVVKIGAKVVMMGIKAGVAGTIINCSWPAPPVPVA